MMDIYNAFRDGTTGMPEQMLPRNKKNEQWYQNNADYFITMARFPNKTRNYLLYSNEVDKADFKKYCSDYGFDVNVEEVTHKDIISSKVKVLLGIEDYRPFVWSAMSTNPEAVNRKEDQAWQQFKEATFQYLVQDELAIREEQLKAQLQGKEVDEQQLQQILMQIQQQAEQKIMEAYSKWKSLNFKDAIEITAEHVIRYFMKLNELEHKWDKGLFHAILSGIEAYYVDIESGELNIYVLTPDNVSYGPSSESEFIEDSEWVVLRMYLTPSEIVRLYNEYLTKEQIEKIYTTNKETYDINNTTGVVNTLPVYKVFWRSLEKVGFLYTADGDVQLVDSSYKKNKDLGDVKIEWHWIPVIEQCTRIGKDIYIDCKLRPNQIRDFDSLYDVKMPVFGAVYDNMTYKPVSIFDRMVQYQYWYDIVATRLEKLIYSDEGKKIAMNYNMIPASSGFDIDRFINYMRKNNIIFLDPNEEGNRGDANVVNAVKEIDLGYAGQIQQYIMLLEYIERRIGEAVGITKEMEGIIHQRQAVANTQQSILQSSKILRPLFAMHDEIKRRVLKGILDASKILFTWYGKNKISYALDEFEKVVVDIDVAAFDETRFDIFIENNDKLFDVKRAIEQLSQNALASSMVDYETVVKILKTDSLKEAELILSDAIEKTRALQQQMQQQQIEAQQQLEAQKHQWKLEEIKMQGEYDIKREQIKVEGQLQKQAMLSVGFNENKDVNKNKQLDVMEIYQKGKEADIRANTPGSEAEAQIKSNQGNNNE